MRFRFTKMHGCGNDYVYVDGIREGLTDQIDMAEVARSVSNRHTGIGSDGLIILAPSRVADVQMIMYNADGSRSEMCGNGLRCTAKLAWDHKHVQTREMKVETGAGILPVNLQFERKQCVGASVLMGLPRLSPAAVPVVHAGPGPLLNLRVSVNGAPIKLTAVGMGNPHAVCFVDDPESFPVHELGAKIERHPKFPNRTNVEFVTRLPDEGGIPVLRQRTWERGAGETQACGTGACATVVAAILTKQIPSRRAIVRLNGGDLFIQWEMDHAPVIMTGPAVTVFEGTWNQ